MDTISNDSLASTLHNKAPAGTYIALSGLQNDDLDKK